MTRPGCDPSEEALNVRDLFLGLREQQSEALVLLDPRRKAALALLPRALHLLLQLPQDPQLLIQAVVARPGCLQLKFQVQRSAHHAVQTPHLHRWLESERERDGLCLHVVKKFVFEA